MIKKVILYFVVVITLSFTGCVDRPSPQIINGKYYMTGDSDCSKYKQISNNRIMCYTLDNVKVGSRKALTKQEISEY